MRLETTDARIAAAVATVSQAALSRESFPSLSVQVTAVSSFDDLTTLAPNRRTPAAYQRSLGRILVNERVFFDMPENEWVGIIAHELGEYIAACCADCIPEVGALEADLQADYVACLLGFSASLKAGRRDRSGEYHAALDLADDPSAFVQAISRWRDRRLAGLTT